MYCDGEISSIFILLFILFFYFIFPSPFEADFFTIRRRISPIIRHGK